MAKLEGHNWRQSSNWFSLEPIKNSGEDATQYCLAFGEANDEPATEKVFSVAGWQSQQEDVWRLAQAFTDVKSIAETTISIVSGSETTVRAASLFHDCSWLKVILSGHVRHQTASIRLFIQEDTTSDKYIPIFIMTSQQSAYNFGRQLQSEIIATSPTWAQEHTQP